MADAPEPQAQGQTTGLTKAVLNWWKETRDDRGARAELRRCHTPTEVAFVPAYYRLKAVVPRLDDRKLAVAAGVLAHVDEPAMGARVAEQFARPKDGGTMPRVSEVRFRRLLRVEDGDYEELYPMMIRLVRQLDRKANIPDLFWGLYSWNAPTKRHWAEAYYTNVPSKKE